MADAATSSAGTVHRQHIDHPSAWTAKTVSGKEHFTRKLTAAQVDAIDTLLAATRHLPPQEVTRAQFDHPEVNRLLAEVQQEIMHGRGVVILSGLDRSRYSPEDLERIFWGFGTHWGRAAVQSPKGDKLGRVTFVPVGPDNPVDRTYKRNSELEMHTDTYELVGLMSVNKGKTGGYSRFVSSIAVHNDIVANRPELLDPLYEGYHFATHEASLTDQPLTPYKVPVFCNVDGQVSSHYVRAFYQRAAKITGGLPPEFEKGLDYMYQNTTRPDLMVEFLLEPGEMVLWHNYTIMHARTAFEDFEEPEKKRLLYRLWIEVPEGRPVTPIYHRDLVAGN